MGEAVKPVLKADLKGRTVLLVGSTTGIGLEAAKHFAGMGPKRLILTGRNQEKGKAVEQGMWCISYLFAFVTNQHRQFRPFGIRLGLLLWRLGRSSWLILPL